MMQVLGTKRVLVLIILIAVNAALAAATYLYAKPGRVDTERQLNMTRAQITQKRNEADKLRNEFEQIQAQKGDFEHLQAAGYISDQNRLVARRRITDIQEYSRVLKAGYNINSATIEEGKEVKDIGYVVLNSPISVDIEAMDDRDFYAFIYWMQNAFPGHISVTDLTIDRVLDINEATLRAIGAGTQVSLIKGNVDFTWRTMVPEAQIKAASNAEGGGF